MSTKSDAIVFSRDSVKSIIQRHWFDIIQPISLVIIAAGLFVVSLGQIDFKAMDDIGLATVLPLWTYLALAILGLSFVFSLNRPELRAPILFLHIFVLIFMLHGITIPLEEVPRFNVTWRHVGIIELIANTGVVDTRIDAYFNWPGFFILNSFFIKAAGFGSALDFASFSPIFFNLLYFGPLMVILHSATENKRLIWFAVWMFYLGNWIGQDYFSPQGFIYFFFLTVLGILLYWFNEKFVGRRLPIGTILARGLSSLDEDKFDEPSSLDRSVPFQRIGLLAIVLASLIVIISSHQLTPFAIFLSIFALTVVKRITPRGLVLITAMFIITWMGYMTVSFLRSNLVGILSNIGQVEEALTLNVTERISGSPGHTLIVRLRLAFTMLMWGLALFGWVRRLQKKYDDTPLEVLIVAPFFLIFLQFYGGEMVLRSYMFSLPFIVFFVSGLIYSGLRKPTWREIAAASLISLVFLGGFYVIRYGNEKSDQFTAQEVSAVGYLYNTAEPNAIIMAPSPHFPAKFTDYSKFRQRFIKDQILTNDVNAIIEAMDLQNAEVYLIITRSQESYFYLFYNYPVEEWKVFEKDLIDSGRFRLIQSNDDARTYHFVRETSSQ